MRTRVEEYVRMSIGTTILVAMLCIQSSCINLTGPTYARSGQYADGITSWVGTTYQGHEEIGPWMRYHEPNEALLIKVVGTELLIWATEQVEDRKTREALYFFIGTLGWYYAASNVYIEF